MSGRIYKMTFVEPEGKEREVNAPEGYSVLEIAHDNDIDLEGVCEGSMALFNPALDVSTMNSFCSFGPGPEGVIQKLWKSNGAVVARIAWLASNAEAQFARLGLAFPFQKGPDGTPRRLTAVDLEHALCYFSRYLSAHDALQVKGARTVHAKLAGLITRKKIQRPSIKWAATLTPKNAARRCAKWITDDAAGKHEAFTS